MRVHEGRIYPGVPLSCLSKARENAIDKFLTRVRNKLC